MLEANSRYSIDTYTTRLEQKGYSPGSILSYVRALEHFFQWLETKGVPMEDATNNHVDLFLYRHLPQCRCAPPAPTRIQTVRAAIHQWFAVVGVKPDELALGDTKSRRIATAIKAYDNYLKDLAGLRDSTRQYRRRYVLELLTTVFSRRPFDLSALTSTTLVRYVTKRARRLRPGSVRVMALSLRSYLKFLRFTGEGRAAPPAECVNLFWSRSSLPATLAELQIVRLLGAFDCTRYSVIETAKANGLEP